MLEILGIVYFSKQIRIIAEEKNIEAKKWIRRLILTWFGIEIVTIVGYLVISGDDFENSLGIIFIALLLAIVSGFYTLNQLKNESKKV